MEIVKLPLDILVPDPQNPRKHPKENIAAIKASLQRFGQVPPLVVHEETSQVVAGNGTMEAMLALGWKEADCILYKGTIEEARALGVVLNRTAELGEWNEDILASILNNLKTSGFDAMESLGFDEFDLGGIINKVEMEGFEKPNLTDVVTEGERPSELKNGNWFYIEFYGEEERFNELKNILKPYMKTEHEIHPDKFEEMVKKWKPQD